MNAYLEALARLLQPFFHIDPAGWFGWARLLSPITAGAAILVGLFCLTLGGREGVFRVVAVPLGLLLGVALTAPVQGLVGGAVPDSLIAFVLPVGLATLSGFVPHTIAFVTLGLFGAKVGLSLVDDHVLLVGAIPGFFLAGVLGIVIGRVIDTAAASLLGALLVTGGILAAAPKSAPVRAVAGMHWGPTLVAAVLFAIGAGLQLVWHGDEESRAQRKAAAADRKQRAKDERARAERFAGYSKR